MFDVHIPKLTRVSELNQAVYNPRRISPEKFDALKNSITSEGFVEPVVVQKKGMCIIGGHQRVRAVKELSTEGGFAPPDLPCVILDIDDVRAKKLNIKLNNLKGDFEARMLGELLVDIYDDAPMTEDDAMDLGFTKDEADKFIHIIEPPINDGASTGDDGGNAFGRSVTLSIEFGTVEQRNKIKKLLADRSAVEQKMSGEIIAHALLARPAKKTQLASVTPIGKAKAKPKKRAR